MSIGALLVGIAILILTAVALADPWVRRRSRPETEARSGAGIEPQVGDGKAILYALRDLDFDYQTGKVTDSDYGTLRSRLVAEAASSLMAEDENRQAADAQVERPVPANRKHSGGHNRCPQCGTRVEREHRFCARCGTSLLTTCESCGSALSVQDSFCSACGEPVEERIGETS
jgi:hypothetical protein